MPNKSTHPTLTHWLKERNAAQRALDQATADAALWLDRAKLAQRANKSDLLERARDQMNVVRHAHAQAQQRLDEAEQQLAKIRAEPQSIGEKEAQFTQELLLSFELMGISTDDIALEEVLAEEAVQQRIQTMRKDANLPETVDALALLKKRLQAEEEDRDA